MKFEHLIEVNNPEDSRIEMLNRSQLWSGLVMRAKAPSLFIPQIDSFQLVNQSDTLISRTLQFGKLIVHDKVEFIPMQKLLFHIPAQGEVIESNLEIVIEEPFPDRFFIRFIYEDTAPDEGSDAMYNDYRRSAYIETDVDTIKLIRQFAAQGRLSLLSEGIDGTALS